MKSLLYCVDLISAISKKDSSPIAFHLKNHSIPKSKFRNILLENTTIIAHEIDNLRQQIIEAVHIKTKKPNIENNDNEMLLVFFLIPYSCSILFPLIVFPFLN